MVKYNKQDLLNFPINSYVEIVDNDGELLNIGTVVGITQHPFEIELYFKVRLLSNDHVLNYLPKRLRRISNV